MIRPSSSASIRLGSRLGNLLGNAIKFCRAHDTITIRGERDGDNARFAIADTGPGISQEELEHIFEPYWSVWAESEHG